MAYSNIAWEIFQQLKSVITTNIRNISVESVFRFPDADNVKPYIATYGRACLVKLDSDEFESRSGGASTVNRFYNFTLKPVVKYINGDQKDIMNLSEEIKYYLQNNTVNGTYWQDLQTINIEYPELEAETNIKESNLSLRVFRDG